jgi:hypothetical protein
VDLEPLYDITLSPLDFGDPGDCDLLSPTDPVIVWTSPDKVVHRVELDLDYGQVGGDYVTAFAGTWPEVGVSSDLREPYVTWYDEDVVSSDISPPLGDPLLPGRSRVVEWDQNELSFPVDCAAHFRYEITFQLRTYPLF